MNPKHLHTPVSTRLRCPVCHQAVYSRGGIHPQCAMRQSEPPLPKSEAFEDAPTEDGVVSTIDGASAATATKARAHVRAPKYKIAIGADKAERIKTPV
jgi:hypothetical protein